MTRPLVAHLKSRETSLVKPLWSRDNGWLKECAFIEVIHGVGTGSPDSVDRWALTKLGLIRKEDKRYLQVFPEDWQV